MDTQAEASQAVGWVCGFWYPVYPAAVEGAEQGSDVADMPSKDHPDSFGRGDCREAREKKRNQLGEALALVWGEMKVRWRKVEMD